MASKENVWEDSPKTQPTVQSQGNSIAFGSAPRREVDSQPISPLARPAVSQTETHSLGFLSVADVARSSGGSHHLRTSSGRMVMQLTSPFLVGGSNPGKVNKAPAPAPPTVGQDLNRRPKTLRRPRYHSTTGCVTAVRFPTAWSLLSENF